MVLTVYLFELSLLKFFIIEMSQWMRRLANNEDHLTPIELDKKLAIFRKHTTGQLLNDLLDYCYHSNVFYDWNILLPSVL